MFTSLGAFSLDRAINEARDSDRLRIEYRELTGRVIAVCEVVNRQTVIDLARLILDVAERMAPPEQAEDGA